MFARDEKVILATSFVQGPRSHRSKWTGVGLVALLARGVINGKFLSAIVSSHSGVAKLRPQLNALYPESHPQPYKNLGRNYNGDAFLTRAVWLGGAVRIPTESYDNMGLIGDDGRWEVFGPFHDSDNLSRAQ